MDTQCQTKKKEKEKEKPCDLAESHHSFLLPSSLFLSGESLISLNTKWSINVAHALDNGTFVGKFCLTFSRSLLWLH